MNKYIWNFDGDAEVWYNDSFDTVDECLKEARKRNQEDYEERKDICFIGELVEFTVSVDPEAVLERIQDDAYEFCGEGAENWDAYNHNKQDELNELSEKLSNVVVEWMKKYNYTPSLYSILNVKEYEINS